METDEGRCIYDPALRQLLEVQRECEETGVSESIRQGVAKTIQLMKDRQSYSERMSSESSDALQQLERETWNHPADTISDVTSRENWEPDMISGSLVGNFLQSFVSASSAKRVLDIGMFTGYSALTFAEALPPDGEVITLDIDPYLEPVARRLIDNSPHGKKIDIRIGPAYETLDALAEGNQQFDIIYIDADKDGYKDQYKKIMEKNLLSQGGSIIFDNALYFGAPYMRKDDLVGDLLEGLHVHECNAYLCSQDNMHRVLLPVRDGIMIVRRKDEVYR